MHKFRRIFVVILCLLISLLVFAGCFDKPNGTTSGNSGTSTNNGTSSSTGSGNSSTANGGNSSTTRPSVTVPDPVVDFCVRTEPVKITDSGRANQHYDVVYLSEKMDVKALAAAGYNTLKVKISLEVKELDDGYQWIFLYSDSSCSKKALLDDVVEFISGVKVKDDPSLLCGKRFEHGSGKKDTSWGVHFFEFNIPMEDLTKDLYIRFGASGKYDDDWQNRNLFISYEVLRTAA